MKHPYMTTARKTRLLTAAALGLLLAVVLNCFTSFSAVCADVRADTLRLHILANSDSDADQTLKLCVRDAILAQADTLFAPGATKEEALAAARRALPQLEKTARDVLRAHGCADSVSVRLENLYFSTRDYGRFTLPAGRYDAVRIELGAHEGKNWFCVLFPPLCVPAASPDAGAYSEEELSAVRCPYELRFAAVEWIESLRESLRRKAE